MELYEEYHKLLKEYKEADRDYDRVLERKAKAYFSTQPHAIDTSKEIVGGGKKENVFEMFVQQLEKIDVDLQNARNDRDMKNYFLKKKELELRSSDNVLDKVYVHKYIDNIKKVWQIAIKINYSREQTYRFKREIEDKLSMTQNDTKQGL